MTDYTDSDNLSYSAEGENKISARVMRVERVHTPQDEVELRTRCPNCRSQVIVFTRKNTRQALDLNYKRHFCEDEDRRIHEEQCIDGLMKIVTDYNRTEFSSFQVELNIP